LLLYPNPTDPLNGEAAALLLREPEKYKDKVKDCVSKFAKEENATNMDEDDDVASELSEASNHDKEEMFTTDD